MKNCQRSIAEVTCPCCGRLLPVEIVLSAAGINEYIDAILVQEGDSTQIDTDRPWPLLTVEAEIDTKYLIENIELVKEYHATMVNIGMAEPLTN